MVRKDEERGEKEREKEEGRRGGMCWEGDAVEKGSAWENLSWEECKEGCTIVWERGERVT